MLPLTTALHLMGTCPLQCGSSLSLALGGDTSAGPSKPKVFPDVLRMEQMQSGRSSRIGFY